MRLFVTLYVICTDMLGLLTNFCSLPVRYTREEKLAHSRLGAQPPTPFPNQFQDFLNLSLIHPFMAQYVNTLTAPKCEPVSFLFALFMLGEFMFCFELFYWIFRCKYLKKYRASLRLVKLLFCTYFFSRSMIIYTYRRSGTISTISWDVAVYYESLDFIFVDFALVFLTCFADDIIVRRLLLLFVFKKKPHKNTHNGQARQLNDNSETKHNINSMVSDSAESDSKANNSNDNDDDDEPDQSGSMGWVVPMFTLIAALSQFPLISKIPVGVIWKGSNPELLEPEKLLFKTSLVGFAISRIRSSAVCGYVILCFLSKTIRYSKSHYKRHIVTFVYFVALILLFGLAVPRNYPVVQRNSFGRMVREVFQKEDFKRIKPESMKLKSKPIPSTIEGSVNAFLCMNQVAQRRILEQAFGIADYGGNTLLWHSTPQSRHGSDFGNDFFDYRGILIAARACEEAIPTTVVRSIAVHLGEHEDHVAAVCVERSLKYIVAFETLKFDCISEYCNSCIVAVPMITVRSSATDFGKDAQRIDSQRIRWTKLPDSSILAWETYFFAPFRIRGRLKYHNLVRKLLFRMVGVSCFTSSGRFKPSGILLKTYYHNAVVHTMRVHEWQDRDKHYHYGKFNLTIGNIDFQDVLDIIGVKPIVKLSRISVVRNNSMRNDVNTFISTKFEHFTWFNNDPLFGACIRNIYASEECSQRCLPVLTSLFKDSQIAAWFRREGSRHYLKQQENYISTLKWLWSMFVELYEWSWWQKFFFCLIMIQIFNDWPVFLNFVLCVIYIAFIILVLLGNCLFIFHSVLHSFSHYG